MVKMQEYPGTFSESYIKQDSDDSKSQNYYVFVFANVTPIADFETYINYLLLSLMVIVGLIAIITIFLTSRKLDKHFGALKSYILRVGNREGDLQPENFAYREFNEVGQTVEKMNDMIDANQRSQQLFFKILLTSCALRSCPFKVMQRLLKKEWLRMTKKLLV